jgi:hypothetical protein
MSKQDKVIGPPDEVYDLYTTQLTNTLRKAGLKGAEAKAVQNVLFNAFWEAYYLGMHTERGQFARALFNVVNEAAGQLPYYRVNMVTTLRRINSRIE